MGLVLRARANRERERASNPFEDRVGYFFKALRQLGLGLELGSVVRVRS